MERGCVVWCRWRDDLWEAQPSGERFQDFMFQRMVLDVGSNYSCEINTLDTFTSMLVSLDTKLYFQVVLESEPVGPVGQP